MTEVKSKFCTPRLHWTDVGAASCACGTFQRVATRAAAGFFSDAAATEADIIRTRELSDKFEWERKIAERVKNLHCSAALRSVFTNDVIRAIGALARQRDVCREQGGGVAFVTGMDAAREYIVEHVEQAIAVATSGDQPLPAVPSKQEASSSRDNSGAGTEQTAPAEPPETIIGADGSFDVRVLAADYGWCYTGHVADWLRCRLEELRRLREAADGRSSAPAPQDLADNSPVTEKE